MITQNDYDVHEVTSENWVDGILERTTYNGHVTEGFMMSMPLTKTILHLMHDVNIGLANMVLRQEFGISIPTSNDVLERFRPELHGHSQFRNALVIDPSDTK